MQRLVLSLAVVLLGFLVVPANLWAQDAEDYRSLGNVWSKQGEYDKAIAEYDYALRSIPRTPRSTKVAASPG